MRENMRENLRDNMKEIDLPPSPVLLSLLLLLLLPLSSCSFSFPSSSCGVCGSSDIAREVWLK